KGCVFKNMEFITAVFFNVLKKPVAEIADIKKIGVLHIFPVQARGEKQFPVHPLAPFIFLILFPVFFKEPGPVRITCKIIRKAS
ncbi:hypothetical protein L0N17_16655, partial [Mediterraneibacter faecis]